MSDGTARSQEAADSGALDMGRKVREHLRTRYPAPAPPGVRNLPAASFSRYYLREAAHMVRFARRTGLIVFSLFRIRPKLAPGFRKTLVETWLAHCLPAYACAEETIAEGWNWQVLSVREYNHLVYFVDFCRRVQSLESVASAGVAQYRRMEDAFLSIACREEYVAAIAFALRKALASGRTRVRRTEQEQANIVTALTCFFARGCLRPGFHDLILARLMVSTRRHLDWSDLLQPVTTDLVQDRYYDCPPEVLGAIAERLSGLDTQITELGEERGRVAWIRDVASGQGNPTETLAGYYASLGKDWATDSADVLSLGLSLVGHLAVGIDEMANGSWQVMARAEKVVRTTLIHDEVLKRSVERLRIEQDSAVQLFKLTMPTKAPLSDFLIRGSDAAQVTLGGRRVVFGKVCSILADMYQVALALKRIRDDSAESYGPGYYLSQMVVSPTSWRGKSLYDVLSRYILLVIHACILFRIRSLEQDQARIDEIDRRVATLEATRRSLDPTGTLGGALRELETG